MKKIIGIILCLVLMLSFNACGSSDFDDTYAGNTNDFEETSEDNSQAEHTLPSAIEGLVDINSSPVGVAYEGIGGLDWIITEFLSNNTFIEKNKKTGLLLGNGDEDKWEFVEKGIIRKDNPANIKYGYTDYFIYKDYLIQFIESTEWGTIQGDSESGYTNNKNNAGDRILKKDGTYEYITSFCNYTGTYRKIEEKIICIDAHEANGTQYIIYLFIDNDNAIHSAYPKVK